MYRLLVFLAFVALAMALDIDLSKEFAKAEADLALKDKERMLSGASSPRYLRKKENRMYFFLN